MLLTESGVVIIDPENDRVTQEVISDIRTRRPPSHLIEEPVSFAMQMFEAVNHHNKTGDLRLREWQKNAFCLQEIYIQGRNIMLHLPLCISRRSFRLCRAAEWESGVDAAVIETALQTNNRTAEDVRRRSIVRLSHRVKAIVGMLSSNKESALR